MDGPVFTLTLPSQPRMLSVARGFVEAVCQAHALDRSLVHSLVLVTGEAVTNIVRHAHRDLAAAQFTVQLQLLADGVALTFQDQGEPFDVTNVPHLQPGELRLGGRGVYLMRALMDELTCAPREDGPGNTLRMVKRFAPVARTA
jgi:serine/threonine-protein kinase RsbW